MRKFIILLLLIIINSTYAVENDNTKHESSENNWYKINNTWAYSIIKYLPDYPILYSPEIISEFKKRCDFIQPIFLSIAINLLIRTYFGIGYDTNLIHFTFKLLLFDSLLAMFKPALDQDAHLSIISTFIQIAIEVGMSFYVMIDSYSIIPKSKSNYNLKLITTLTFPIITGILIKNLYHAVDSKSFNTEISIQHPRLVLLNKIVKTNMPLFVYSDTNILESTENDNFFIKINKWMAMHKNDISLNNLFKISNHPLKNEIFDKNDKIKQKADDYYIISKKSNNCAHLKLGIEFIHINSEDKISKEYIEELLHDENKNHIIEANKDIENYNISTDLPQDKHQYITIINYKSSHYLLVGLEITNKAIITRLINNLLWPTLFENVPYNEYITLCVKFKSIEDITKVLEDISASFEDCNSRVGIYQLKNINKEAYNNTYKTKKVRFNLEQN